ncbi:MAG: bacillithiol biosynthesis cysteine-adding enzyme BshC [Bacteroidota bacterium]|nr:bacillithiol biosynthesis cysteine-adding enzyme BshC [Bacteroidota bacterium]
MTFNTLPIDFKISKTLNQLVADYINQDSKLKPFYSNYPDSNGFKEIIKTVANQSIDRVILVEELDRQHKSVSNTSITTLNNIQLLKNKNCYTVTTGHQLCLFTGPLYFIYKIFSTINLAEELKNQFPENDFVPIYWMASEDHDFEEVNHFNVFGKTITWESKQTGAVGDFKTKELETLVTQLKEIFGETENGRYLFKLFSEAYLRYNNLKDATRYIVNELFGNYGLVILDGNALSFKTQFVKHFKTDILKNLAYNKVTESINELEKLGYKAQVNPRSINCFYMEDGLRARIEKQGDDYIVLGTDKKYTEAQLNELIENHPEKISPNVVLRPLYQQYILPNIAYVGGPGELAYWLQYKSLFEAFNINYPLLVPRTFITVIEKNIKSKLEKLNFSEGDIFKEEIELVKEFQIKANATFELDSEKKIIENLFAEIQTKINTVDKTLNAAVSAEQQKATGSLDILTAKANKALKQKLDTEINQIKNIKQKLFPNTTPQERFDNFSTFYLKYGNDLFTELKKVTNPLGLKHLTLVED